MEGIDRCSDCGQEVGKRELSGLSNVCDECWDNRMWLIKNINVVGQAEFQKIQQFVHLRTGEAKRVIENHRYATYNI